MIFRHSKLAQVLYQIGECPNNGGKILFPRKTVTMDLLGIIRAYEILKSHGFDIHTLITKQPGILAETNQEKSLAATLSGNILQQLDLSQECTSQKGSTNLKSDGAMDGTSQEKSHLSKDIHVSKAMHVDGVQSNIGVTAEGNNCDVSNNGDASNNCD